MAKPIFLAAPESSAADLGLIDKLLVSLQVATSGGIGPSSVFVPHLAIGDVGVNVDAGRWFERALTALKDSRVILAVLDGPRTDDGVAFFAGYAFAAGKPVVGYRTDRRLAPHPLIEGCLSGVAGDSRALAALIAPFVASSV